MPKRPIESYRKVSRIQQKSSQTTSDKHQHGTFSLLLDLPQESLTHITSYLLPPSLLALARTCRYLYEHIDDDNTWLRAFLNQFFGISPEHELEHERILLLKRTENTWRKEFILRHDIRRQWERSRNPTVTHAPQHASIDGVHLMSAYGLLTASLQYGIVARSIPLNGKVLRGYIDASGTGLGIGNPNVEFTPDVSACAMSSEGGTARVFWGKRNGEVAFSVVNRVMDARATCTFMRCGVNEQHDGAVQYLIPDSGTNTLLSAGADGRMKLWDTRTLECLWSTDQQQQSLVVDPFLSIAGGLGDGFVAGALRSGDILLYGLHESETPVDGRRVHSTHQLRLLPPIRSEPTSRDVPSSQEQVGMMWLCRTGDMNVQLLVQYMDHPHVYCMRAQVQSHAVTTTAFGDKLFSNVSALQPILPTHSQDMNMLLVGDVLGFVSIYDASDSLQTLVAPVHRFEAHTDGAVAAIAWSSTVFATGSSRGTTVVWDSLTLEPVRYFTTPAPRPAPGQDWDAVRRLFIDNDLVVIVIGNRVMTWKVGETHGGRSHKKPKHANAKVNISTKGHQRYEMRKDITESYMELEYEMAHTQRVYSREREQRSTLDTLGLSELEAVEYVLMLSREEEEARQRQLMIEEGVFEGEFDDLSDMPVSPRVRSGPSTPSLSQQSRLSVGRVCPRVSVPVSNEKVQVSPPFVPEPMEAGTSISPLRPLTIGSSVSPGPLTARSTSSSSLDYFPAISSGQSSTSSSKRGVSTSPKQRPSAWSTPLKLSPTSLSPRSRVVTPTGSSGSGVARTGVEMDDDLKLAIELSLAEARSRGDKVMGR